MVEGEVVSPTAILVKWSIVRACSEGDGMVVKYRVHFTAESSGEVQHIEELNVTKLEASLTGLSPYTNYSIQIMNSTKVQNPRPNSYAGTGCRTPSDCIGIRYTCAYKFTARVKSTA